MGTIYHIDADSPAFEDAYAEPLSEREPPRRASLARARLGGPAGNAAASTELT